MNNVAITIGRQYGSGGRFIGRKIADSLGYDFYDKELITIIAKQNGVNEKLFENVDEHPTNSLLYSLAMGSYSFDTSYVPYGNISLPLTEQVFQMQSELITQLSQKGPAVFVGRCADYILKENPNCIKIFISSDIPVRSERLVKYYGVKPEKVKDVIKKADKTRSNYYKLRTDNSWGDVNTYDLCINSGILGIDKTAELLLQYIKMRTDNQ